MEWVPVTNYDAGIDWADQPRKLTEKEITYIVQHLPLPPSADVTAARVARESVMAWLVSTLKEVNIAPSAIPDLIQEILHQHTKSLVTPGTPVGITAAEAVGATTTQMTLNTFHSSGSAKSASFGIEAMRDIIFARKNPKNESSTIYFTDRTMSYEDVLNARQYIVGSVVADFIQDYEIDRADKFEKYWWHTHVGLLLNKAIPNSEYVMRLTLNVVEMYKHRITIEALAAVLERESSSGVVTIYGPIGDGIIDVYPHDNVMVTLKSKNVTITVPTEIAEVTFLETIVQPEFKNIRVKGIAGIKNLYPVVSPVWRIVMLERKLSPEQVTAMVGPNHQDVWSLFYNRALIRSTGLSPENLAALCQAAGIAVLGGDADRLVVEMPANAFTSKRGYSAFKVPGGFQVQIPAQEIAGRWYLKIDRYKEQNGLLLEEVQDGVFAEVTNFERINGDYYRVLNPAQMERVEVNGTTVYRINAEGFDTVTEVKPSEYVSTAVSRAKEERKREIKRVTDANIEVANNTPGLTAIQKRDLVRRTVYPPHAPVVQASEFIIAETDGSNLKDLLAVPGIDKKRTTCNNMYTIANTLGIEAARSFIIRALSDTIASTGSYVHPTNITFIAEFITSLGEPYGATYTGISRQPGGHLSLATLERAGNVFIQNAIHGRKEDIRNVSASVAVGTRMSIGSGAFDVGQIITENGVQKTVINDDLFTALDRDDASMALAAQRATAITALGQIDIDELTQAIGEYQLFDDRGNKDEANLVTVFQGEVIPELTERIDIGPQIIPGAARRVASSIAHPEVPADLINVLDTFQYGYPLDEKPTMVTGGVKSEVPPVQPTMSTGLVYPSPITIGRMDGVPSTLTALLDEYVPVTEDEAVNEPLTVVMELPRMTIPALPSLGATLEEMQELRREQVRELEAAVDEDALMRALAEQ